MTPGGGIDRDSLGTAALDSALSLIVADILLDRLTDDHLR